MFADHAVGGKRPGKEAKMIAALNMGIVGTIIVVALAVALVLFLMRRAA
jgi:hypothetical protein